MRRPPRTRLTPAVVATAALLGACGSGSQAPAGAVAAPSLSAVRAERRAYDGAPPTAPHADFGAPCGACHDADGQSVGAAYAPASPHLGTAAEPGTQRCRQCHAFVTTNDVFVANAFIGLPQNLRAGGRAAPGAPPTIPHRILMRENCVACHAGPGAREEIRSSHPERARCRQCHVPVTEAGAFPSAVGPEGG
jgi:cytochrome c-type protein NapB